MRSVRDVRVGQGEAFSSLYFGYCDTGAIPKTDLDTDLDRIVEQMILQEPDLGVDYLRGFIDPDEAVTDITSEKATEVREALATLLLGEDIPLEQKKLLSALDDFVCAVIDYTNQPVYDELNIHSLAKYLEENGLIDEVQGWIEDDDLDGYFGDMLIYPVYECSVLDDKYGLDFANRHGVPENIIGRRKVVAELFVIKLNLAIGALYAKAVEGEGDVFAGAVADALSSIVSS